MLKKRFAFYLTLMLISGCTNGTATDLGCTWAKPIYPSRADVITRGTAEQIVEHNETGAERCGWQKPNK